jgi:hypothetical protein
MMPPSTHLMITNARQAAPFAREARSYKYWQRVEARLAREWFARSTVVEAGFSANGAFVIIRSKHGWHPASLCGAAPTRHPAAHIVVCESPGSGRFLAGPVHTEEKLMNRIIYIVGAIVIVLFILGFLGLR